MSDQRLYWRSLEQLNDDPEVRPLYENEFAEGVSTPPDLSRRSLMTLMGATLSMAGLSACRRPLEHIVPYVEAPEQIIPGIAQYYSTTMPFGTEALGLVVESHEGRPTKIEGNPRHPATEGGTSTYAQAAIYQLYDPDRSQRILHDGEPASWEELEAAWGEISAAHAADGGSSLAVMTESFSSPTLSRLAGAVAERFPNARWVVHEPVSDENAYDGAELATGQALRAHHDFGKAKIILSLDSDFLGTETDNIRSTRGFADGRRISHQQGPASAASMNRLYVVEGDHSITGANADHRLRVSSGDVASFAGLLVSELSRQGLDLPAAGSASPGLEVDTKWLQALTSDLLGHRGGSLIVAGRRQPPEVHAAALALNRALGNVGSTIEYRPLQDVARPQSQGLVDLVAAIRAGSVKTLVILGANGCYNAPADLEFDQALESVEQVVHLGYYQDETAAHAGWHIPQAHFLEAWGDARSGDGTLSVAQPLIEPLFGGKSAIEILALMVRDQQAEAAAAEAQAAAVAAAEEAAAENPDAEVAGAAAATEAAPVVAPPTAYQLIRETWRSNLTGDFEKAWRVVLHDGLLQGSSTPAVQPTLAPNALSRLSESQPGSQTTGSSDSLEIVFKASPSVFDGRFANIGWLQELPNAMTKLTWDNAAMLSPSTASDLGVGKEDVVRVAYDGREITAPIWVVPGLADNSVVLELGYGRTSGGQLARGAGVSAYKLQTSLARGFGQGATIAPTGETYEIAQTQDHHGMEGRPLVREATIEDFQAHPEFAQEAVEVPHESSMWEEVVYDQGNQWGMTIDLNACVGCNACTVACQSENNIPVVGKQEVRNGRELHWIRLDRYFAGAEEDPETVFQPVPCMHCENAPCEQVCPVAATVHDSEGLNVMAYNRCIGTRYCANNCPYKVRRFNYYNFTNDTPEILQLAQNPDVTIRSRGVMEKCTYCTQRINAAKLGAKKDGRAVADGDVQTACQQACPAKAIEFGNTLDETSRVAVAKASVRNYGLLGGLYTRPRTTYLAKLRNPHPDLVEHAPDSPPADDHAVDEGNQDAAH